MLELKNQIYSYIYGLLLADGNLSLDTRNRGRVVLEVAERDKDILYKINEVVKGTISFRKRITNFSNNKEYCTFIWRNSKREFREELMGYGFNSKDKSTLANIPNTDYDEKGFWRGIIDGNGSLGYTEKGFPFLSLVTKSENLGIEYLYFLKNQFSINKIANRNNRDSVYNLCIFKEDAQRVSKFLYEKSDIFVARKYNLYLEVIKWVRPDNMKRKTIG
jgi:DNA-binding transcriptional regulator WhiA